MRMNNVHFIREIVVLDARGRKAPRMQISYAKPWDINPTFRDVPREDQKQVRGVYEKLGGGRLKQWTVGLTVIIPNEIEKAKA